MVAVRMVSEGVDVPRLAVGVYATSASTPLFFAQAVGRFVRSRRAGETASVFLPSVPVLLGLASELEAQRDHVLGKPHRAAEEWNDEELAAANRQQDEPGEDEKSFTALHADAELDQLIYDGTSFSADEEDFIGLPGLLAPDQVRNLLSSRQKEWLSRPKARPGRGPGGPAPPAERPQLTVREQLNKLRKELNTLVALQNHRTKKPHGMIHNELRAACGGPPTAMASIEQLEERIATLLALGSATYVCARMHVWGSHGPSGPCPEREFARHSYGLARHSTDSRNGSDAGNGDGAGTGRFPPRRRCAVRRGGPAGVSARLHLDVQFAHLVAVGSCVVPAEEELSTGGQDSTDLGSRSAAVTAVGGGQLGPGKGSRLHSGLLRLDTGCPRYRSMRRTAFAVRPLLQTHNTPALIPGMRRDTRHVVTWEVRPPAGIARGRSGLQIQLTTGK